MSDDKKQLTVSELLARAGRDTGDGEAARPRRRRRSLEEGGISVAELTGSIPAVKEKPAESKHSSVPIDAPEPARPAAAKPATPAKPAKPATPPAAQTKPTPATDETAILEKVEPEATPTTGKAGAENTETGEMPVVPEETPAPATPAAPHISEDDGVDDAVVADRVEDGGVDKHEDAEERSSVTGMILMTVIGVVLGVVVFKGFEMMWDSFTRPLVAGLAILVTVGMVAVVKALRTANDGLSMFLAALVGVVMTFGPLAVVLL